MSSIRYVLNKSVILTFSETLEESQRSGQLGQSEDTGQLGQSATEKLNENVSQIPISSVSDFLTLDLVESHLDKLDANTLKSLYSDKLPPSISENPTEQDILDTVRSGFFQQSEQRLSEQLRRGNGAGYLLAQSLKYDYKGEGVANFLDGIREAASKEVEAEVSDEDEAMQE